MNAEIKQKWIEALRSGKYQQTTGQLRRAGAYCCLGVLCEVVGLEYDPARGTVPDQVAEAADVHGAGRLPNVVLGKYRFLVELNDFAGYDFNQIANVIEEQL